MIKIREVFTAKAGMASKLAKVMQEAMKEGIPGIKIMTDVTGDYNTVVMEYELENLSAFEKMMADMDKDAGSKAREKMKDYAEMYLTGRREVFRIW